MDQFVARRFHVGRHRLRDGKTATSEEVDALGAADEHVQLTDLKAATKVVAATLRDLLKAP